MFDVHCAMCNALVSMTQWPNPGKKQTIGSISHRNKCIAPRTLDIEHLTTAGDEVGQVCNRPIPGGQSADAISNRGPTRDDRLVPAAPIEDRSCQHLSHAADFIKRNKFIQGMSDPNIARPIQNSIHSTVVCEQPEVGAVGDPVNPRLV